MKKYNGVIVPMVTPVSSDRKLDEAAVVKIADFLARNGVSMLVLGTTGESPSVSMDESARAIPKSVIFNLLSGVTSIL